MKLIYYLAAAVINPIAWPAWLIERLVRIFKSDWQFNYYTSVPYFITLFLACLFFSVQDDKVSHAVAIYLLTAMQLLCMWICMTVALGSAGEARDTLRRLGRRQYYDNRGHVLLTPYSLFGAIISYFYTVIYFGFVSYFVYLYDPKAYTGVVGGDNYLILIDFFYFSMVTITTLGYGDILPVSVSAKAIVFLELSLGLLFVVFIFGAFVSYRVSLLPTSIHDQKDIQKNASSSEKSTNGGFDREV